LGKNDEAIILVGGLGTRLGSLTKNIPKPMLPIRGIPFLERFLQHLKSCGFKKTVLATGYKSDVIESYFQSNPPSLPDIEISLENEPLGTGGAIAKALEKINTDEVTIFNGDSYLDVDYEALLDAHLSKKADITIASRYVDPANRYGVVSYDEHSRLIAFEEKGINTTGFINGGVYLCQTKSLKEISKPFNGRPFSFEEDVLTKKLSLLEIYHFPSNGFFIDIGVPKDYERAQVELFNE